MEFCLHILDSEVKTTTFSLSSAQATKMEDFCDIKRHRVFSPQAVYSAVDTSWCLRIQLNPDALYVEDPTSRVIPFHTQSQLSESDILTIECEWSQPTHKQKIKLIWG